MYIADMHCDTIMLIWLARREGRALNLRDTSGSGEELQIDLLKLKEGGSLVQNFAIYVDLQMEDGTPPWTQFTEMAKIYHSEIAANADIVREACSYDDIIRNRDAGLISSVLTIEDGGVLGGDLDKLRTVYDEGVRMITLTWNYENELGYPNDVPGGLDEDYTRYFRFEPITGNGLKARGFEALEVMGELGIIPDVSHLSDEGFYDVAKASKVPFVASHSNCRALCGCNRNMTDDMIRLTGEKGGVIGLNFCPEFIDEAEAELACKSTIEGLAKHARRMIDLGGKEVVGIGTDFDGIGREDLAVPNAAGMQKLAEGFEAHGFTADEIEGICYKNVMRVYREVLK